MSLEPMTRSVRLPGDLDRALAEYATERGMSVSDVLREAVRKLTEKPCGYRCNHVTMTFPEGVIGIPLLSCGCAPKQLFAADLADLGGAP